jgi:hypothetical protein
LARAAELRELLKPEADLQALNDDLAEYHEMAESRGTTLAAALSRYIAMESLLRADTIKGIETVAKNFGLNLTAWAERVLESDVA